MSKPKTGTSQKPATPPAAGQPPVTSPAPPEPAPAPTPTPAPKPKARAREYADGYQPVGTVRVIAEGEHARVLEDDVRRWKEPL